jgi:hypothetical protein
MIKDMKTTYETVVIGHGKHASIEIPDKNLKQLGANRLAPLKITINDHTYQSTATGVDGKCMVVFPSKDRESANDVAGDHIYVTLELDSGYRNVDIPMELINNLEANNLSETFRDLSYSKRKEFARQVREAKAEETKKRRIEKILSLLERE